MIAGESIQLIAIVLNIFVIGLSIFIISLVYKETGDINKNIKYIKNLGKDLEKARPLFPQLWTERELIMNLAIDFTKEATKICAMGTISSVVNMHEDEKSGDYIRATVDHIMNPETEYTRIMDFDPTKKSEAALEEIKQNVEYFVNLLGLDVDNNFCLYHNPNILTSKGDFHFRVSNKKVVIRLGGHGNKKANAAISITKPRVIEEFQNYYDSLLELPETKKISTEDLKKIKKLLEVDDCQGVSKYLNSINPLCENND